MKLLKHSPTKSTLISFNYGTDLWHTTVTWVTKSFGIYQSLPLPGPRIELLNLSTWQFNSSWFLTKFTQLDKYISSSSPPGGGLKLVLPPTPCSQCTCVIPRAPSCWNSDSLHILPSPSNPSSCLIPALHFTYEPELETWSLANVCELPFWVPSSFPNARPPARILLQIGATTLV